MGRDERCNVYQGFIISRNVMRNNEDKVMTDSLKPDSREQSSTSPPRSSGNLHAEQRGQHGETRMHALKLLSPGYPYGACDANSRPDKKLVTIMSLPVRSCLCRRHSERFGGPFRPRQWLRLLRRSTCSKRGSVRTVFFFQVSVVFFWWSFITTVGG